MKAKLTIKKEKLLLVEGEDEKSFFDSLLRYIKLNSIQTEVVGGNENFKNEIPKTAKAPGFKRVKKIAVIRDAEKEKAINAFTSVKNILEKVLNEEDIKYSLPERPGLFSSKNW